jgi:ribonucleotide reductase beta subunit family protein with ferritin-like domain
MASSTVLHLFNRLSNDSGRLSMYPIREPDLWALYKQQLASFWTAEEIDFGKDRDQWNTLLTDNERLFLKSILAFFAGADSVVSLNLMNNFCKEVDVLEAQTCYTYQAAIENIHSEVYSIMIDTYIQDPEEKDRMFMDLGNLPCVKRKVEWAQKWSLSPDLGAESFPQRLIAFCIVEGLFFSGAFCAIYWIKQRNLLPGLTKSNEFIARDEGMHTQFACILYNKLSPTARMSQHDVHKMFQDALEIEAEFITESVPCGLIGMNAKMMLQYIQYVADGLLAALGYSRLFLATNPFPFMDLIGLNARSNFFEERVSQYQKAAVLDASKALGESSAIYTDDF